MEVAGKVVIQPSVRLDDLDHEAIERVLAG